MKPSINWRQRWCFGGDATTTTKKTAASAAVSCSLLLVCVLFSKFWHLCKEEEEEEKGHDTSYHIPQILTTISRKTITQIHFHHFNQFGSIFVPLVGMESIYFRPKYLFYFIYFFYSFTIINSIV